MVRADLAPVVLSLLMLLPSVRAMTSAPSDPQSVSFPADAGIVDVTRPPYNARGDGKTDDTDALQRALDDHTGQGTILYLPNGVYLVSRSLRLPLKTLHGQTNWGNTHLQGQSQAGVIMRLRDSAFTDADHPVAVLDSGPHGSADWFFNSVQNLTIDTGRNNPGAIGLRFFSNNTGCVRNVTLQAGDRQGVIGLDLAYNDMNGPLLVKGVTVRGFAIGVACGNSVNSQTFCDLRLENQTRIGFLNEGQFLAIEHLASVNSVPALVNRNGLIALVKADLKGNSEEARKLPAIRNGADLYARDIRTEGYGAAIERSDKGSLAGPLVVEYTSNSPVRLFPGSETGICLPIRETPEVPWDLPSTWASPTHFGASPGQTDDTSAAIQAALDSGATTVYLPPGAWKIGQTLHVRGKVRRIIGIGCVFEPIAPLRTQSVPLLRIEPGAGPVSLERLRTNYDSGPFFFVEQASMRPLILRDTAIDFQGSDAYRASGGGAVFIENVVGGRFRFGRQQVWARQLNQESEGTHLWNTGGSLWILGLKTERGGTLIDTTADGKTEVLGGLCYTTTAGKLAPMFVNQDASVSVTIGERCYGSEPYSTIVREIRKGVTREFAATDPAYQRRLVLYVGRPARKTVPKNR